MQVYECFRMSFSTGFLINGGKLVISQSTGIDTKREEAAVDDEDKGDENLTRIRMLIV